MRRPACLLVLLALSAGCSGGAGGPDPDTLAETAGGVLTLQGGTISELKDRRGIGPFRRYELPPAELLELVATAARKARGRDGKPLETVWVRRRALEVVAKEPAPEANPAGGYDEPWRSAMVATIHPVLGVSDASRLEIHAMNKGPFHRGVIQWERDLPRWIDEVIAAPRLYPGGIKPIR